MLRAARWIGLALVLAAGCTPALQRQRTTFAVLAGVYYSAGGGAAVDGAMVEDAEGLLVKAIADINARKDLDFVVVAGDLLARADALSLDRAKALLAELRAPYYVVLGAYDGPGRPVKATEAPAPPTPPKVPAAAEGGSRSTVIWSFQGHGFSGPDGYWVHEVLPGLVLVGLDTVQPGRRAGHVDAQQLAWLDETLSRHADRLVLVVGHHGLVPLHPLDEGTAWQHLMVDNAEEVRQIIERHPNVLMVVSGHHHFAGGRIAGSVVYLASPSVSVWPLAYHLVRLTPKEAEAVWVPLADGDLARKGQERLLGSAEYRGVFPAGEDGDTACVRLFGGNKMTVYPLPAIRP
ncbi:MAG TPA: metallophosphoesterase [Phycisphaerae bacterium]|nr:metallophosphoesterase [Phycisphaerae bacterium]